MSRILLALALLALAACNLTGKEDPIDETEDIAPDMDAALTGWSQPRFIAAGEAQKVVLSPKGEVYVAGYYTSKNKAYLRKYSASGSYQWMKTLPRKSNPHGSFGLRSLHINLEVGSDNKLYMLVSYWWDWGSSKTPPLYNEAYVVSASGALQKQFSAETSWVHYPSKMLLDSSNNFYILTNHFTPGSGASPGTYNGLLTKYSPGGTTLWKKTIGDAGLSSRLTNLVFDISGNVRVLGQINMDANKVPAYALLSLDPAGNQLEAKALSGADFDGDDLAVTLSDGRMAVINGYSFLLYDPALGLLRKRFSQIIGVGLPRVFTPLNMVVLGETLTLVGSLRDTGYPDFMGGYIVQRDLKGNPVNSYQVQNSANDITAYDGKLFVVGVSKTRLSTRGEGVSEGYVVRYNPDLQPPPNPIPPRPSHLDASFGTGGMIFGNGIPTSMVLQSDGKILVAGNLSPRNTPTDMVLARYNTGGSLDTSFDGDGIVTPRFDGASFSYVGAMALQSDGKIVLAGYVGLSSNLSIALARYNPDGSLDTSFDGDGKATTAIAPNNSFEPSAVAIQGDGKTVLGGSYKFNDSNYDFALFRYNKDGSLDTAFGVGGMVTTDFAGSSYDIATAMAIDRDGKIVLAGLGGGRLVSAVGTIVGGFGLARYNQGGSLDASFGNGGKVLENFTLSNYQYAQARSVGIQSDGKIIVGGAAINASNYDFALARYNPNGSLDTSFDGDGLVTTALSLNYDYASSMALGSNGKIVLAGLSNNYDLTLIRYTSGGSLDASFGEGGKILPDFGSEDIISLAIQTDGKIVTVGKYDRGFMLLRFSP